MHARAARLPSYRHHKPSGLAVVSIGGRDIYLGKHDTAESRAEYDRLIAEWLANEGIVPRRVSGNGSDILVNELLLAYLGHADTYYVKNGKPTSEPGNIRLAIRPLRKLYGHTLAGEFGPLQLEAVRQAIIGTGILCRSEVNRRVRLIVQAFKWAVAKGMVPPSLHHGLQAVSGLRRGRRDVRETEPSQAGSRSVCGRDPALRGPTSLGNDRVATLHGHAAGRSVHNADDRREHGRDTLDLHA